MTLRTRLLLVLVGVVAVGLVVTDVTVYTQLRSYLLAQSDPQLRAASYPVERAVLSRDGLSLPVRYAPPVGSAGAPGDRPRTTPGGAGGAGGAGAFPFVAPKGGGGGGGGLFPAGTVGEVLRADGLVKGSAVSFYYGGRAPAPPVLPHPLPQAAGGTGVFLTASTAGSHAVTYRVLVRPLHHDGLTLVVAIPLTGESQTLGRLALVMVLVSVAVLLGLGLLAWWIVRRGLRPLDEMALAAAAIAGGDLGRRVTPTGGRTEVGRLGAALNTMLGEIEEAFADRAASEGRLRRFLADASHELRTPLTSIRGYAEIFDLGARENPEDLATAMHHIREEADRMHVLVDDLLLLARLDRERPLELVSTDLVPVVTKAVVAARAGSPTRTVALDGPGEAEVVGDATRLRQVADNLLANAVRHSPEGAPVEVRLRLDGPCVLLEVEDHGPGVRPEDAERIFEPFVRADSSRTRVTGGAGLGLAIVAAIVRNHGGSVGVRPGSAGGAVFWARIPACPASGDAPSPGGGAVAAGAPGPGEGTENRQLAQSTGSAGTVSLGP